MEKALFQLEVKVVELCNFENVVNCMFVIFKVSTSGDTDVIHVNTDCGAEWFMFEDYVAIDVVHHGLERCWGIGESEIHDRRFKKSVSRFKCCFWFISFADAHVIITPSDVKFGVYMCITEVSDEVCDERKGVLVSDGNGVDLSVVLHQSHFAVLFVDEEE